MSLLALVTLIAFGLVAALTLVGTFLRPRVMTIPMREGPFVAPPCQFCHSAEATIEFDAIDEESDSALGEAMCTKCLSVARVQWSGDRGRPVVTGAVRSQQRRAQR